MGGVQLISIGVLGEEIMEKEKTRYYILFFVFGILLILGSNASGAGRWFDKVENSILEDSFEPMDTGAYQWKIQADEQRLVDGIALKFGTYVRQNYGNMDVVLYENGQQIDSWSIQLENLKDNEYQRFYLHESRVMDKDSEYIISVNVSYLTEESKIVVYSNSEEGICCYQLYLKQNAWMYLLIIIWAVILLSSWLIFTGRTQILTKKEWAYLAFCFGLYFLWSAIFVMKEYGPDEKDRILVPLYMVQHRTLPTGLEEALMIKRYGFSYAQSLVFPYYVAAFLVNMASGFTSNASVLLVAMRFGNVLAMTLAAFFAIRLAKKCSNSKMRWIFILLITATPQIFFWGSYFNLDAYSFLAVLMIIYQWIDCIERGWDNRSCALLGLATGYCFVTYEFVWGFILCSALIYIVWYIRNVNNMKFSRFMIQGIRVLFFAFLVCGFYFVRNIYLFGTPITYGVRKQTAAIYAESFLRPDTLESWKTNGYSVLGMFKNTTWWSYSFKSLIAVFGYMEIYVLDSVYWIYLIFFLLGVVGTVIGLRRIIRLDDKFRLTLLFGAVASAISVGISIYYSWSYDYEPQGRYILGALPLIAAACSYGMASLTQLIPKCRPQVEKSVIGLVVAAIFWAYLNSFYVLLVNYIY